MSSAARWANRNTAIVTPFLGFDQFTQTETWGTPYTIACTWTGQSESVNITAANGNVIEYQAKNIIWTEDNRPKRGDRIQLNAHGQAAQQPQIIMDVTEWDASALGEPDAPDFRLVV